jgi:hypothetical protein
MQICHGGSTLGANAEANVETRFMSIEEFASIPDNPRQRDTEKHARKATRRHLKKLSPVHSCVSVAAINGVPVCKLDGHTRCLLWQLGKLERPASNLIVSVFAVSSLKEAAELYSHFDNTDAAEGSSDKLSGACREAGLELTSNLFSGHTFNTSLKFAYTLSGGTQLSEYELVPKWATVIKTIDDWQLDRNPFKGSGILSLMLVAVASRSYQEGMLEDFFNRYAKDMGEKSGVLRDGVQALREHMVYRRLNNLMTGYQNTFDMMSKGYSCLKAWSENLMIKNVQPSREALIKLHAKARANIDAVDA